MRPLEELVNHSEPAMPVVSRWIAASNKPVEVLPCERTAGERCLLSLQVTTRSPMGALAYQTGGLIVDRGWLRILGAGHARLTRTLATWNNQPHGPLRVPGACLVADDAVGGFFAINGGAFAGPKGHVFYLAPDTLRWEDTELGFSGWLQWVMAGDFKRYYETNRWKGWQDEVRLLPGDQAFSIYPYLFSKGPPISLRARRPVPVEEVWRLFTVEIPAELAKLR